MKKKRKHENIKKISEQPHIKHQGISEHIINQMKEYALPVEQAGLHEPGIDEVKMSEVILRIAEPYVKKYWNNYNRVYTLISLAVIVWNFTLFPEDKWETYYDMLIDHLLPPDSSGEEVASLMQCVDTLIERKKKYFPDIRRFITNYEVLVSGDNITLNIESVPLKDKSEDKV